MKASLLLLCCLASVLVGGCSTSKHHKVRQPARPVRVVTYDPVTDRTTLEGDGHTWYLKGNFTSPTASPH